jgi:hypothetical protein
MRAFHHFFPAFAVLLFAAGCGMDGPAPSNNPPAPQAASTPTPKPDTKPAAATPPGRPSHTVPDAKPAVAAAAPQPAAGQPAVGETATAQSTAAAPATTGDRPGYIREKAAVGMGEKGRGYGHGYIAVAAASFWAVKERIALNLIQHAMDLYKADHDGKGPRNHEEFMQKIVKENDIKLPMLPEGHKYEYDPTTEELMVMKPEDPNEP